MHFMAKWPIAIILMAIALAPVGSGADMLEPSSKRQPTGALTPSSGTAAEKDASTQAGQLTGKERLGEKWQDEQRVDNCKVPVEKRGTRSRPDSCVQAPEE